jgi:hypothetical protein
MAQLNQPDEAVIIGAILAGNSELFHDLIRPHEQSVYRMALSMVKNESDAEDLAQEADPDTTCRFVPVSHELRLWSAGFERTSTAAGRILLRFEQPCRAAEGGARAL